MAFDEDPDDFFNTDDFSVTVTYNGNGEPVVGDFTQSYRNVNGIATSALCFDCAASDVPDVAIGSTITDADGVTYKVVDPRPDGEGFIKLFLNRGS